MIGRALRLSPRSPEARQAESMLKRMDNCCQNRYTTRGHQRLADTLVV